MTMDLTVIPFDWITTLAVFGLAVLLVYLYGTWTFSTWSQLGIPGPKPLPYIGNTGEFRKNGVFKTILAWSKEYGKHVGFYLMKRPVLLTTDVEILKEVFIKDFTNYTNRVVSPLLPYPLTLGLAFVEGQTWKRQRHTMSPTFSSSKLRLMGPFITDCCQNLLRALEKSTDAGKLLDVKKTFGSFTLDVIAGTGFGFETNSLEEEDNLFLKNAKNIFGGDQFKPAAVIANVFPSLTKVMKKLGFSVVPLKEFNFLTQTIQAVIEERKRAGKTSRKDLTQLMLDAEASDSEVANNPDQRSLTREEIIGQGLLFFVAGYETTATSLQFLSYLLAINPEIQDKLYNEITAAVGDGEPHYDNVLNISYLDSCIREALRIFPPAVMVARQAVAERTINGVTIPAGSSVAVNIVGLMRSEEFFPQPEKFIPERFEDNQHPIPQLVKEMIFGAGPRQCIGMRLSLYETKMAIASVVRKFRFVKTKETPEEVIMSRRGLSSPAEPIFIATERR